MKKYFILLLTCFALSACASVGKDYNEANISLIRPGETTINQAISMFGQPSAKAVDSDGTEVYSWSYAKAILGSAKGKGLSIKFKDGVVEKYTTSQSSFP